MIVPLMFSVFALTVQKTNEGPLDFRCDNMKVLSKPNRTICADNVVMRRGTLLLCCQRFVGQADEKWQWKKFTCHEDVRAFRADELLWADQADFLYTANDLILTGSPLLQRGHSVIIGDRAMVDVKHDHARVVKPRGVLHQKEFKAGRDKTTPPVNPPFMQGPLPLKCPLPESPQR